MKRWALRARIGRRSATERTSLCSRTASPIRTPWLSGCGLLMSFVSCASGHRCPATSLSAFPISSSYLRRGLETRRPMWPPRAIMGIPVVHTGYRSDPTIEFTWALILASARNIVTESSDVRSGGWQETVGADLGGKDPWRSGTWADWIAGRADWERFWHEFDCLEPEYDARYRQGRGRNPGFQGAAVRAGRYPH